MKKILATLAAAVLAMSAVAMPVFADHDNGNGKSQDHKSEAALVGSSLEVNINGDGGVLVRGAKVTAVSSSTISATTAWGSNVLSWTVNVDGSTELVPRKGENKITLSDIMVDHIISFKGDLVTTGSGLVVNAKVVKDWSIEKKEKPEQAKVFEGTLKSVASTTLPTTLVVTIGGVDYTVNVAANISILNNLWLTTSLSNFHVADHIRLYGTVSGTTITASVVRDTSISI